MQSKICSNIKCYGHRAKMPCYTHKELTVLAKKKGVKPSGSKEELCGRLGIKFYNFRKFSSTFEVLGFYEYNSVGLHFLPTYTGGDEDSVRSNYQNRMIGMVMEKIIMWSVSGGKFDLEKSERKNGFSYKDDWEKEFVPKDRLLKLRGDVEKIFDKLDIEYAEKDVDYLMSLLKTVSSAATQKELSKNFPVITSAYGGAISYALPQVFERVKFETIVNNENFVVISPLFGYFNIRISADGPAKFVNNKQAYILSDICQLCLLNLPYFGYAVTSDVRRLENLPSKWVRNGFSYLYGSRQRRLPRLVRVYTFILCLYRRRIGRACKLQIQISFSIKR